MMDRIKECKNVTYLGFALAFLMTVFAPLDLLFSNIGDLWFDVYDLLPVAICEFVGMFVLLVLIGALCCKNKKVLTVYETILAFFLVAFYIQGNFIDMPYGSITEDVIIWENYWKNDIQSAVIWIALLLAIVGILVIAKREKLMAAMRVVAVCFVITQLISVVFVGIRMDGFKSKIQYHSNMNNYMTYSDTKNFNILVMDTYDSRVFYDYMMDGRQELMADTYEDFTYYRDTLGAFTLTDYAMPHIITGERYYGDRKYSDYIEQSYSKDTIVSKLKEQDYKVNLYCSHLPQGEAKSNIDNISLVELKINSYKNFVVRLGKLIMFKYAPTPLKRFFYIRITKLDQTSEYKTVDGMDYKYLNGTEVYPSWDNLHFIMAFDRMEVEEDQGMFHLYHLKGLHSLRDLDNNLEVIQDEKKEYSLMGETGVLNLIINRWITSLKEKGIYDNSVIVIMADHGASDYIDDENFIQCPILLIKGVDEHHEFRISDAPLSYDDLQIVFDNLLNDKKENEVVENILEMNNVDVSRFQPYSIHNIPDAIEEDKIMNTEVGRRRSIIFHRFKGDLNGAVTGGDGYDLYTDYHAFNSLKIEASGVIY